MTKNAFIYRRPAKWPIAIVLTAAVLIHLSAVAIAFHQETRLVAVGNAKAFVLSALRPDYPYGARSRHITGSSIAVITVDPNSGLARDVVMAQSIGNAILDDSTVSAFRRWRFRPGTPAQVRIPITFVLTGAQY